MTEHFTREEAEKLALRHSATYDTDTRDYGYTPRHVHNLLNAAAEIAVTAKLKEWEAQGAVIHALPAQPAEQPIKLYADSNNPDMFNRDLLDAAGNRYTVMTPTMAQFNIDYTELRAAGLSMVIEGLDPAPDGSSRAKMFWRKCDGPPSLRKLTILDHLPFHPVDTYIDAATPPQEFSLGKGRGYQQPAHTYEPPSEFGVYRDDRRIGTVYVSSGQPTNAGEHAEPVNAELAKSIKRIANAFFAGDDRGDKAAARAIMAMEVEANKALTSDAEISRAQAAPSVGVPDKHLTNLRNATNILQSLLNGTTSSQLAQAAVNAFNEYLDASAQPQQKEG